jgi:hypothetical protein
MFDTFSITDSLGLFADPAPLDYGFPPSDLWSFAPFNSSTPDDSIVAISNKGRELTAGEVREAIEQKFQK